MPRASTTPRTDNGLLAFAKHFASVAAGQATVYSFPTAQVSGINTATLNFTNALAACDKAVRVPSAVLIKNEMRAALENEIRLLTNYVNGIPTITPAQKADLGIPSRKRPTTIGEPTEAPVMHVTAVTGRTASIGLHGTTPGKRSKPSGVATASVFTAAATADGNPPTDMAAWAFYSSTGRTSLDVVFGPSATAGTVYVTAFWANAKGESGPSAAPLRIELPASQPVPSAAKMKIAA